MERPLRVLIVEDESDDAELMVLALQRGGINLAWERVDTADGLRAALSRGNWDAVLSDYTLPGFGATQALEIVRATNPHLPFLVISGTVGEEIAVELMRTGASDYVLKQNLTRLAPAFKRELLAAKNRLERHAAEGAVRQLAAIVSDSDFAIVSQTLDGIVTSWNTGAERLYGYTAEEMIGKASSLLLPADLADDFKCARGRIVRGEHVPAFDTVRVRKNGLPLDVSLSFSPIRDEADRIVGVSGIATDIAERKKAEAALRTSENRLRAIFLAEPECVKVVAPDGFLLEMNPAGLAMLEIATLEEAKQHNLLKFVTPPFHDAFRELHQRVMDGNNGTLAFELVGLKGTRRWMETHATPLRNDAGEVESLLGVTRDMTKRRQAEMALHDKEAKLAEAVRLARIGYWNRDLGTGKLEWSDELFGMFGVDPAAFGHTLEDFLACLIPEDRDVARERIKRAEVPGGTFDHTYQILVGDQFRWIHEIGRVVSEGGTPRSMIGTAQDVTDREQAEETLRLSEERYRSLIDATASIVWDSPASGAFDTDQPAWTAFTGQTVEQHKGYGWLNAIHPDDREKSGLAWATAVKECTFYQLEHRIRRADGEYRDMTVRAVPIFDGKGEIREFVGVHTDVTDQKRAESALLLRDRAIQAATQGLIITDSGQPDNPIVYVSPSFERITGYGERDYLGRNCRFLQGKDTDPTAVARLRHAVRNGEPCTEELLNYRKDGSPFWNQLSISPVRDTAGALTHFIGVTTDVTDRRKLEDQFHQSQKMEAFGKLAGGVAHDFNNLLTIINGYSELLLQDLPEPDPAHEMLLEIQKAGERSAGLTRQLLAFSRQQILAPRLLDLNEVIVDTGKMLRRLLGEDIRLTTTLDPDLWAVRADPGQIEQVLMNLSVNARDAMPQGGRLTIESHNVELDESYVRAHPDIGPGRYALISVSDTGTGIAADTLKKIFEPFFTTKGPGKGTGLGLATAYGIIKQSGGHFTVYSEVGIGTTFKFYLPAVEIAEAKAEGKSVLRTPPRGTETILIAEDETAVRALIRNVLTGCGYTVLEAADGDEAVQLATEFDNPIHLLITDVVMPGLGGRSAATQVAEQYPDIRVLYISGYTDDAVIRHGVLREGVNFLQKPFTPASLAAKVRDVLNSPIRSDVS